MDRSDERKDHPGSILDIGETAGASLPPSSDDEVARRRRRMREGVDEIATGTDELQRRPGATGIDMGAGGEGTDVE